MSNKKRNGIAQSAHFRSSAGPMKHKNTPRGGASNDTADLIEEFLEEELYLSGSEHEETTDYLSGSFSL